MRKLTIQDFGDKVQGVRLLGDKKNPEPIYFRVYFPGGDVNITRTETNEYWFHLNVKDAEQNRQIGKISDARLDITGMSSTEADLGDFAHPHLYHLAVKVTTLPEPPPAYKPVLPLRLNKRETAFVLYGLRLMQQSHTLGESLNGILQDGGVDEWEDQEIDALCEKVNCS